MRANYHKKCKNSQILNFPTVLELLTCDVQFTLAVGCVYTEQILDKYGNKLGKKMFTHPEESILSPYVKFGINM